MHNGLLTMYQALTLTKKDLCTALALTASPLGAI